jgi:hypothetical protein
MTIPADSPFHPDNQSAYAAWRSAKLAHWPITLDDLIVDIADPYSISDTELAAITSRVARYNMAIYRTALAHCADKEIPRRLAAACGLVRLDSNLLADEDGITSITVNPEGDHPLYIPYTNKAINWHCDGYYNRDDQQIRGMVLHCVVPAASGGENSLLDHEMLYLQLRDENPDHIRALMAPTVMTIPAGRDGEGGDRGPSIGPVFSVDGGGALHMRYTARKRNIEWASDSATQVALTALDRRLSDDNPYILRGRLEAGMGLICNNILHTRDSFNDDPDGPARLLYRARYFDRVAAVAGEDCTAAI